MRSSERGEGLVEVVVAVALVAIALAAILSGTIAAAHRFGAQPADTALRALVQNELDVAVDVLKYQGATLVPSSIATTAPLPGSSPMPVHVSLSVTPLVAGGYFVSVDARADTGGETARATVTLPRPAPLPSSQIAVPNTAQAPI